MENNSHLLLSEYQRAILNEMGVSSWQLASKQSPEVKIENKPPEAKIIPSAATSKEDALAKLKQLKVQTQSTVATDSVLLTFAQSEAKLQIFNDVLIAFELDSKQQKYIPNEQLTHYSDYPLSWTFGDKIKLSDKQLNTPTLAELHLPASKKQLWQQIQSAFLFTKI